MKDVYLSCSDVVNMTGRSRREVMSWCASGKLKASRPGGKSWMIKESDLKEFLSVLEHQEQKEASEIMTCADVVQATGAKKRTVWNWCRSGKLKASRPGGRDYVIRRTDFEEFLVSDNRRKKGDKHSG